ncbi:alpha/beta hydrolase [Streptomyces sp. NPDC093228]|uniref:alpha/beta hydrolase n=1 Tax=Streptomyces sp. NPDC093228 TaxID=3155070 RepID=UPI0034215F7E
MGPTSSAGRSIRPASVSTTGSKREIAELGDVAATHQVLDALDGSAVLVGHSYGGVVITVAGNHEKVSRLVHVAAFAPGKGESVNSLIADPPRGAPVPPILPPRDGFLFLDRDQFAASFAADIPVGQAAFMADSQVPRGVDVLSGAASQPAWRTKPTWYLVATDDRMIPPPAQRAMAERAGPDRRGPRQPLRLRLPARRGRRSDQADRTRPTGRPRYGGHAQRPHTGAPARTADARSLMTRGTGQRPATIGPPSARPAAYLPQRLTHTGPATRAGRGGWRRPLSCPRAGDVRQSPGRLAATPGGGKALETEVVEGEAKLM